MVQSFSLTWDSYKSNICTGFSTLQQNGEFVDMTLAADGHLVKVHQVMIALASPYLKELISSAPCQHPVLFLNNVSHGVLALLLEYIYTGEVMVPADSLTSFIDTGRTLHIKGFENMINNDNRGVKMAVTLDNEMCHVSGMKRMVLPTGDGSGQQISLPANAREVYLSHENNPDSGSSVTSRKQGLNASATSNYDMHDYSAMEDDMLTHDSDEDGRGDGDTGAPNVKNTKVSTDRPTSKLQFTVSIRGSLQVILNRYIYNLHSTNHRSGVRRWRCVEYRNNRCSAFVVTKDNIVLNRANLHNHPFHDKKILAKIEKKAVYSAIDEVEGYKEKEGKKDKSDDSEYVSLDFCRGINTSSQENSDTYYNTVK